MHITDDVHGYGGLLTQRFPLVWTDNINAAVLDSQMYKAVQGRVMRGKTEFFFIADGNKLFFHKTVLNKVFSVCYGK